MTETVVRTVNVSLLFFGFVETVIIAFSFKLSMLERRSANIFFSKVVLAGFCMLCFYMYNMRWIHGKDPFNIILLAIGYVGMFVIYYLYLEYLIVQINELSPKKRIPRSVSRFALAMCIAGSFLRLLSVSDAEFNGMDEALLHKSAFTLLGNIAGFAMIGMTFVILYVYTQILSVRQTVILCFMPVFIGLATLLEPYLNGIELHYPCIIIEILIVFTQHHLEVSMRLDKEELAQAQTRIHLTTGRMKPHYIYNVLTSIYYLCDSDPETAQSAIGTFAEYLRSTLEVIENDNLVSFSWELKAIKNYLELEKLRFGDRLNVEYDIEVDDFNVPPLSLQALIENAVKHGIAAKAEGGNVKLRTRRLSGGGVQVGIKDNGVGFDIDGIDSSDKTFEGIRSVRERLRVDLGAEMAITSTPGNGTNIIINIRPIDSKKNE